MNHVSLHTQPHNNNTAMVLFTHQWVIPFTSTPQLRERHGIRFPPRLCCAASANPTSQGVQKWVQTQVFAGDQLNRPHVNSSDAAEVYDLDMHLLASITQAARQPGKHGYGSKGHRARTQQQVNIAALEAVLDAAGPDAEQLSRCVDRHAHCEFALILVVLYRTPTQHVTHIHTYVSFMLLISAARLRVVSHLAREHAHNTLLPIARWSLRPQRRQRYASSCLLHTRIMHLLSNKAVHARAALSVFGELQKAGVELDVVCVNAAINAAGA